MTMFTVAGVSINKGRVKVRFCSDRILRIKNLQKQGDTDINLIDLPKPMNKVDACQYLLDCGQFSQYNTDIIEIQGKKTGAKKDPLVVVTAKEIDPEIEELKKLAA